MQKAVSCIAVGIARKVEEVVETVKKMNANVEELTMRAKYYSKVIKTNTGKVNLPIEKNTKVDPRLRVCKAIRKRQVSVDVEQTEENKKTIKDISVVGLVGRLNGCLEHMSNCNGHKIQALMEMENGGLLMEMSSEEGARWIKERSEEVEAAIGIGAKIKRCMFPAIIKFVPITLDPELAAEQEAIKETSSLTKGALASLQ